MRTRPKEWLRVATKGAMRLPRRTLAIGSVTSLVVLIGGVSAGAASGFFDGEFGNQQTGQNTANGILLPSNQWVKPIGTRTLVTNGRLPSSTLSPDGTTMAAMTWQNFTGFLSLINVTTAPAKSPITSASGIK